MLLAAAADFVADWCRCAAMGVCLRMGQLPVATHARQGETYTCQSVVDVIAMTLTVAGMSVWGHSALQCCMLGASAKAHARILVTEDSRLENGIECCNGCWIQQRWVGTHIGAPGLGHPGRSTWKRVRCGHARSCRRRLIAECPAQVLLMPARGDRQPVASVLAKAGMADYKLLLRRTYIPGTEEHPQPAFESCMARPERIETAPGEPWGGDCRVPLAFEMPRNICLGGRVCAGKGLSRCHG